MRKRKKNASRKAHTLAQKIAITKRICADYESNEFTLADCVKAQGIAIRTFHYWHCHVAEVALLFNAANNRRLQVAVKSLSEAAPKKLNSLIHGEWYEETTREAELDANGKVIKTHVKTTKKWLPPSPTAVIFACKNAAPDNFRDRVSTEISGPQGGPIQAAPQVVNFIIPDNNRAAIDVPSVPAIEANGNGEATA